MLLTSEFYNVCSRRVQDGLRSIRGYGNEIGLHFDELAYPDIVGDTEAVKAQIVREAKILSEILDVPVTTVSYHRPSKAILAAKMEIPGLINSYGTDFFDGFKYVSDSRHRWREPVMVIIRSGEYPKLHILTHAFWYHDEACDLHDAVAGFIQSGNARRYDIMAENITDLESIMARSEVR